MPRDNRLVRETDDAEVIEEVLNRAEARGPANSEGDSGEAPFVPLTKPLRLRTGLDPAHLGALADDLEVNAFLDLSRRLTDSNACE